jgi:DNA-binding transcriptional regulator YiaG/predicted DNA-binding transcriptional regulator AlpA
MFAEEYLKIPELAARLKLSRKTIRNKMSAGVFIKGVHYFSPKGMGTRFKWSAIVEWMEQVITRPPQMTTPSRWLAATAWEIAVAKIKFLLDSRRHFVYKDNMSDKEFRKLRQSMEYSQAMLSREIDVSIRGISRWENGEVAIPKIAELALKYIVEKHQTKRGR